MTCSFATCSLARRLSVRPFAPDRALVSVVLPAVHLTGMWARRDNAGRVHIEAPRIGRDGDRPAYALQPGFRELVANAVAEAWAQADASEAVGR